MVSWPPLPHEGAVIWSYILLSSTLTVMGSDGKLNIHIYLGATKLNEAVQNRASQHPGPLQYKWGSGEPTLQSHLALTRQNDAV